MEFHIATCVAPHTRDKQFIHLGSPSDTEQERFDKALTVIEDRMRPDVLRDVYNHLSQEVVISKLDVLLFIEGTSLDDKTIPTTVRLDAMTMRDVAIMLAHAWEWVSDNTDVAMFFDSFRMPMFTTGGFTDSDPNENPPSHAWNEINLLNESGIFERSMSTNDQDALI